MLIESPELQKPIIIEIQGLPHYNIVDYKLSTIMPENNSLLKRYILNNNGY